MDNHQQHKGGDIMSNQDQVNQVFRQGHQNIATLMQILDFQNSEIMRLTQALLQAQKNKIPKMDMPEKVPNKPEPKK